MKIKLLRRLMNLVALIALLAPLTGCEWIEQRQCHWYLMPDPENIAKATQGFIPVCARNLEINMEYCRLQATLEFTEKNYGKKFKFVDMELDMENPFPRKVKNIKFCD